MKAALGASASATKTAVMGFAGLGAMGYPMAGHLARRTGIERCLVWNRSAEKAVRHAAEHGSIHAKELSQLGECGVVLVCLPTSAEDALVVEEVAPFMQPGSCVVSCTSGVPTATRRLAKSLRERFGVHLVDCPVSGGPRGAQAGTLTCMLGADDGLAAELAASAVNSFAAKVVPCGPCGAGHAVKAVNNALNVAHLLLGTEGLLALQKLGVDPAIALEAINGSSGRSLQTEQRIPQEVLSGRFGYGFKLDLMAKDCSIAQDVLQEGYPEASLLPTAIELLHRAKAEEAEPDADYTRAVQLLERRAGATLRAGSDNAGEKVTSTPTGTVKSDQHCTHVE